MTINALIGELEKIRNEKGNIEVVNYNCNPIHNVALTQWPRGIEAAMHGGQHPVGITYQCRIWGN